MPWYPYGLRQVPRMPVMRWASTTLRSLHNRQRRDGRRSGDSRRPFGTWCRQTDSQGRWLDSQPWTGVWRWRRADAKEMRMNIRPLLAAAAVASHLSLPTHAATIKLDHQYDEIVDVGGMMVTIESGSESDYTYKCLVETAIAREEKRFTLNARLWARSGTSVQECPFGSVAKSGFVLGPLAAGAMRSRLTFVPLTMPAPNPGPALCRSSRWKAVATGSVAYTLDSRLPRGQRCEAIYRSGGRKPIACRLYRQPDPDGFGKTTANLSILSIHRWMTRAVIDEMVAKGWIDEGVAMCVLPPA